MGMADAFNNSAFEKRIKKHVIGKMHRFTAVAPLGFEDTLAQELNFIGVETDDLHVAGDGKVEFTAKITEAWKAVAYSRIANRVLMEIANFKAENFGQLEKHAAEIPWELFLVDSKQWLVNSENNGASRRENLDDRFSSAGMQEAQARSRLGDRDVERGTQTYANATPCAKTQDVDTRRLTDATSIGLVLHTTCKHSRLYHSDAVEERVKKIINEKISIAQNSKRASTFQHLYINLLDDRCTICIDLAGEELYKRGHERFVAEAPLKETIAAAMIFEATRQQANEPLTTNHQPTTIVDPMAGSGTFSLEAAYIANGLIPGKCRDFALKHQPAFKEATWRFLVNSKQGLVNNAQAYAGAMSYTETQDVDESSLMSAQATSSAHLPQQSQPPKIHIITSDISERPISIIKHNVESSPLNGIYASAGEDAIANIDPQLKDFFSYTIEDFRRNNANKVIILLNPPYGKRLDFNAPKLYTKIGQKLTEWSREAQVRSISLTVAILAPKDDTRNGAKYTCTANLLKECPALNPRSNRSAKIIETSHGGFSLNAIFAKI